MTRTRKKRRMEASSVRKHEPWSREGEEGTGRARWVANGLSQRSSRGAQDMDMRQQSEEKKRRKNVAD